MTACFNRLWPMHRKTPVFADHRHLHRGEELNKHSYVTCGYVGAENLRCGPLG